MSTIAYDVDAVRARFSSLDNGLTLFDGPGGTQVPDSVIDAVARYYRESNANVGGPYGTSIRTEALIAEAHDTAGRFLGCSTEHVTFGPNMTSLNFTLTRTAARTFSAGDEILVTGLDHDANVSPWLELAHDLDLVVRIVGLNDDTTLDLDDLERKLSERTKVVAFPLAANAVGTLTDAPRIAALAHDAGALAWADAVHFGPHGPIDVEALGVDVLICSPYKFFGPHLGVAFARGELLDSWRPYKVRPAPNDPPGHRFETGTQPHELLAGFVAAVEYVESIGWDAIQAHERALGERFLRGLPDGYTLHGLPTMDGRVATFAFTHARRTPREVATTLGDRGIAVWHGDYYAVELMRALGLADGGGAVRAGLVHYNTEREVDRLAGGAIRLLIIGGTRFAGRAATETALANGHEVTTFTRGQTNPDLFPGAEMLYGDRDGGLDVLRGREWDAVIDTCGYYPRVVEQSVSLLRDSVPFYVFISSISAYGDLSEPPTEDSPTAELPDDVTESLDFYGPLKARVRARRAACVRRRVGDRQAGAHRRAARSDRSLHVLAASHRARRRRARAGAAGPRRRR